MQTFWDILGNFRIGTGGTFELVWNQKNHWWKDHMNLWPGGLTYCLSTATNEGVGSKPLLYIQFSKSKSFTFFWKFNFLPWPRFYIGIQFAHFESMYTTILMCSLRTDIRKGSYREQNCTIPNFHNAKGFCR